MKKYVSHVSLKLTEQPYFSFGGQNMAAMCFPCSLLAMYHIKIMAAIGCYCTHLVDSCSPIIASSGTQSTPLSTVAPALFFQTLTPEWTNLPNPVLLHSAEAFPGECSGC